MDTLSERDTFRALMVGRLPADDPPSPPDAPVCAPQPPPPAWYLSVWDWWPVAVIPFAVFGAAVLVAPLWLPTRAVLSLVATWWPLDVPL